MLTKVIVLAIFVITKLPVSAQSACNQKFGSEGDFKRLWYLNNQYIQSWVRSDTGTYNKLLWAEDFVQQNSSNGYLYPKKELMPIFGNKRFDQIEYFFADNTFIQFITDSAAMIFSRPPILAKGEAKEYVTQYNDVYVKRNGNWICVAAHITAIADTGTPYPAIKRIPAQANFVTLLQGNIADIRTITAIHKLTRLMLEQADMNAAVTLLDDTFILLDAGGNLSSKQQLITLFKTQHNRTRRQFQIQNLFIRFVAMDIAMVHGALVYSSANNDLTAIQFSDVFVKREDTWKCVASNNTPIKN